MARQQTAPYSPTKQEVSKPQKSFLVKGCIDAKAKAEEEMRGTTKKYACDYSQPAYHK